MRERALSSHQDKEGNTMDSARRIERAFTLIELLVVVAIIALLIAILLPSLSSARAQGRTAVCASRMSQLCRAFLQYMDDYNETPPFMGRGWEYINEGATTEWPIGSGITVRQWMYLENWLMPDMPDYWSTAQSAWPAKAKLQNGSLFQYTRYEEVYRCPDFTRVSDPNKSQNLFNYSRWVLGRMWYHLDDPEGQLGSIWSYGEWAGAPGPIVRSSQVYAPGVMFMLIDERWNRHCAAPPNEFSPPSLCGKGWLEGRMRSEWFAADCMFGPWGNEFGQYHGANMQCQIASPATINLLPAVKRANVAFYDGHVALELDPLPDRDIPLYIQIFDMIDVGWKYFDWIKGQLYAQRGVANPNLDIMRMIFP
jgi:prepilin-type N-terminal cleavage/methylation domain-containing protein/prepilin-type processing-associated H-X9-DG protein